MPLKDMHYIFIIFFGLVIGVGLAIIFIGIMHLFMPKPVLDKYFKPPYFKVGNAHFYRYTPWTHEDFNVYEGSRLPGQRKKTRPDRGIQISASLVHHFISDNSHLCSRDIYFIFFVYFNSFH